MAMFSKSMKRASRCSSCVLTAKLPPVGGFLPLPETGIRAGGGARANTRASGMKKGNTGGDWRKDAELVYRPVRIGPMMASPAMRSNDRILQKALVLFSDKGYDATSVREICEAAGITKPTLYHFYGSKEGVYRAIVDGALARFRADMVCPL